MNDQTVNTSPGGGRVNQSGLSEQQRELLGVIAREEPDKRGRYYPKDVFRGVEPGSRSQSASLSRALVRLECRDILIRHHHHIDGKKHGTYFFTLTEAGCALVNEVRGLYNLPALAYAPYTPEPQMSAEEFDRRIREMNERCALRDAVTAAEQLSPAGLEELRCWIDQRLEAQGAVTVNSIP
jgi:hypothetical protein